jgi:hypothetical protein
MLYVTHFSYEGPETNPVHGSFVCLAEAEDLDACLKKCHGLIADLHAKGDLDGNLRHIYLDAAVQVKAVPQAGVLTHMITRPGPLTTFKSLSLPDESDGACEALAVSPDSKGRQGVDKEPFITLE